MILGEGLVLVASAGGVALLMLGVVLAVGAILDPHLKRAEEGDA